MTEPTNDPNQPFGDGTLSRRRLFALGGAAAALTALLAACGGESGSDAPGRVGYQPAPTPLPDEPIDDAVYLRTLQSIEYSILGVYATLKSQAGLDGEAASALDRFITDHTDTASQLGDMVSSVGGDPYECPNPWYEARFLGPTLDFIFGSTQDAVTGSEPSGSEVADSSESIPPSDDIPRDAKSLIHALEVFSAASAFQFTTVLTTPELRQGTISLASAAERRGATMALQINAPLAGYVSPVLLAEDLGEPGGEGTEAPMATVAGEDPDDVPPPPLPEVFVITNRFAQLTATPVEVGAPNELNLRFKTNLETPSNNAFIYHGMACSA